MHAFITTAAILAGLMPALAQQPPASTSARPSSTGPAHDTYVLVGCLEAESGPAPVTGVTLSNATAVGQAPPESDSQPAAVGTSGRPASGRMYRLQANPVESVTQPGIKAEALAAEVGHRVQVTVRPLEVDAPAPVSPTAGAATTTTPAVTPPPNDNRAATRFAVTALSQVSTSCSGTPAR